VSLAIYRLTLGLIHPSSGSINRIASPLRPRPMDTVATAAAHPDCSMTVQYVPNISCPPLSVANAHGCPDRPHTNRACCCRTTKEPLSEKKTNTQWSVLDPRFLVHEACVLVGRRGELSWQENEMTIQGP